MKYTVKQLADVAGVTPRTLHYYDQIELLRPAVVGDNGYRYYDEEAVLRLQQIMFYRELDFSLAEIQAIIDEPEFDLLAAIDFAQAPAPTATRAVERPDPDHRPHPVALARDQESRNTRSL